MPITIVTGPAAEPFTSADAGLRTHLRLTTNDDDAWLDDIAIPAARGYVEEYLQRALITRTLRLTCERFPGNNAPLELYPSLQSVASVKYIDTDGVQQTWAVADYLVDIYATPGRLSPAYGVSYPTPRAQFNAVEVVFDAGYGADGTDVPAPIRQALLLLLGHLYENREAALTTSLAELPLGVAALLAPYRVCRF